LKKDENIEKKVKDEELQFKKERNEEKSEE
jgi:ubiquitin